MPTGYTYEVQEGKITTLEDFAKHCGRAFLWQARESNEKDLVKLVESETTIAYYEKQLKESTELLEKLVSLSDEEWEAKYASEEKKRVAYEDEYNKRKATELLNYTSMLEKVRDWTPPTPKHEEMKKFMIDQLEKSIEFDCQGKYWRDKPVPYDQWRKNTFERAQERVIQVQNDLKLHIQRKEEFLEWVNQLLNSVKGK